MAVLIRTHNLIIYFDLSSRNKNIQTAILSITAKKSTCKSTFAIIETLQISHL